MKKMPQAELAVWEKNRDLNAELLDVIEEINYGNEWERKTEFSPQPDGSVHRTILRYDGTVEKIEIIGAWRSNQSGWPDKHDAFLGPGYSEGLKEKL